MLLLLLLLHHHRPPSTFSLFSFTPISSFPKPGIRFRFVFPFSFLCACVHVCVCFSWVQEKVLPAFVVEKW
jgi:hypothetical protein